MRLSSQQICAGIQHEDRLVRSQALSYFTDSYAKDPAVMEAAIQAIDRFGRASAFASIHNLGQLKQSDDSVAWLIKELRSPREDDPSGYQESIATVLVESDYDVLAPHLTEIEEVLGEGDYLTAIQQRLDFRSQRTKDCWAKLEEFAERERETEFVSDADLPYAYRLVEAIADNPKSKDRVMELLQTEVDDSEGNPLTWMEGFAVRLAGDMQIAEAIPLLINKLREDAEWLNEECVYALAKFNNDEVVEQLAATYEGEAWHFRLSTAFVLEAVHSDKVVDTCRQLIELGDSLQIDLTAAMLNQFDDSAIELAQRVLTRYTEGGEEVLRCRQILVAVATLMGVDFPELREWRDEEVQAQNIAEAPLASDFEVVDQYDELLSVASSPASPTPQAATKPRQPSLPARASMFQNRGISRNDPCPCGSGKKYKKCCMRR